MIATRAEPQRAAARYGVLLALGLLLAACAPPAKAQSEARDFLEPTARAAVDLPPPAEAEPPPMVWTREYTVRPGLAHRFLELLVGRSGPVLDRLTAEGVLLGWGVARPFNLVDGQGTHLLWLTLPGWTEADALVEAMARLETELGPQALAELENTLVPGSRRDRVLRHVVLAPPTKARPLYLRLGFHRARLDGFDAAEALYRDFHLPLCGRLQQAGTVLRCGLSRQEVVTEPDWTHLTWWQLSSLADLGRLEAAFAEAADAPLPADAAETAESSIDGDANRSPDFWSRYRETFDRRAYRTAIYRVLHRGGEPVASPAPATDEP